MYDRSRRDVDPSVMSEQGSLEAGPLEGRLILRRISKSDLSVVESSVNGHPEYQSLGRKIIRILYPPLEQLIRILRTNYGQYWIADLEPWDSHKRTLGAYCMGMGMEWTTDAGEPWTPFLPDKPVGYVHSVIIMDDFESFRNLISQEDWSDLGRWLGDDYSPTLAAVTLARAHQFQDQGETRYALVEGVTGVELAISEFVRRRLASDQQLLKAKSSLDRMPLSHQLVVVGSAAGVSVTQLKSAVSAVDMRNKVVHEGAEPPKDAKQAIRDLLRVGSALLDGPQFKFASARSSNLSAPADKWEEGQHRQGA